MTVSAHDGDALIETLRNAAEYGEMTETMRGWLREAADRLAAANARIATEEAANQILVSERDTLRRSVDELLEQSLRDRNELNAAANASPPSAQVASDVGELEWLKERLLWADNVLSALPGDHYAQVPPGAVAAAALTSLSARLAETEREASEERRLIGDLRARIATLTERIRPFANIANGYDDVVDPDDRPVGPFRLGLCRAARAALHPEKASDPITGGNADG